jgi:hypothetical protein
MSEDKTSQQISWEMLNLCIGSVFELIEKNQNFTTSDVANTLGRHGVTVTGGPARPRLRETREG